MKKGWIIFVLCISVFIVSGCEKKSARICTTVYPVQYLMERIGEPHIEICNLSSDEAIQVATIDKNHKSELEKSDALLFISGLEPYFAVYNEDIRNSKTNYIDLSSKVFLYPFGKLKNVVENGQTVVKKEPYYDNIVFDNVDVYKYDPFVWQDPMTMLSVAELVRDYLIGLYPEHEAAFRKNYKELEYDITKLDASYQMMKNDGLKRSFVSMTSSFGNWQEAFGIDVYPVVLSKYGALPNEEQLNVIKQSIRDNNVRYIAHEKNLNEEMKALYDSLVLELDLTPVDISNISSLNSKQSKEHKDYLTIMYENLKALESMGN